ncbi:hypothetical protein [Pseudomonas nicosulfuronedens]
MHTISDVIEGDQALVADTHLLGIIAGSVVVKNGAMLLLEGVINGDLTLEANSSAIIRGTVSGSVFNNGGKLEIRGVVTRAVHRNGGETLVHRHAIIGEAL